MPGHPATVFNFTLVSSSKGNASFFSHIFLFCFCTFINTLDWFELVIQMSHSRIGGAKLSTESFLTQCFENEDLMSWIVIECYTASVKWIEITGVNKREVCLCIYKYIHFLNLVSFAASTNRTHPRPIWCVGIIIILLTLTLPFQGKLGRFSSAVFKSCNKSFTVLPWRAANSPKIMSLAGLLMESFNVPWCCEYKSEMFGFKKWINTCVIVGWVDVV